MQYALVEFIMIDIVALGTLRGFIYYIH